MVLVFFRKCNYECTFEIRWEQIVILIIIIIIIIIKIESAMQGRKRVRTLSIWIPQPHTANPRTEEKDTIVGDKKKEQN